MQNNVLSRVVERSLAGRRTTSEAEVRKLVEAGIDVMRRTGSIDPPVRLIVAESGTSNQAFYKHFRGKDELLLAIMSEGRRELLAYLERRMGAADDPIERVRRWVEGVVEQARNPRAADATRPFAVNAARIAHRFPAESAAAADALKAPLRDALADLGTPDPSRDADAVYQLAVGTMERSLVHGDEPTAADVDHLVGFALRAVRTEAA